MFKKIILLENYVKKLYESLIKMSIDFGKPISMFFDKILTALTKLKEMDRTKDGSIFASMVMEILLKEIELQLRNILFQRKRESFNSIVEMSQELSSYDPTGYYDKVVLGYSSRKLLRSNAEEKKKRASFVSGRVNHEVPNCINKKALKKYKENLKVGKKRKFAKDIKDEVAKKIKSYYCQACKRNEYNVDCCKMKIQF